MGLDISVRAAELLHGALDLVSEKGGWVRPVRLAPAQVRAVGSVRAWHPGLFRQMAACTAGISLELETDATRLELEVRADELPRASAAVIADVERHACAPHPPYDGLSIQVDDRRLPLALPGEGDSVTWLLDDPSEAPEPGLQRLPGMGEPHHVRIWLPCLTSCSLRWVRSDGTYLTPVPARRQLVVLGDSIAQGFVGCDPGRTWPARLADHLGLDLVNQGIGAQVFQAGSLAGVAERTDAAAVVVEFGANYRFEPCQASRVERDVKTYLYEVAEAFPEVPVWVLTRLPHLEGVYPTHGRSCAAQVDDMIRAAVAAHPGMRLVEGAPLLDADDLPALLADGSDHPGPAGQKLLAERLSFVMDATADAPEARRERALDLARGWEGTLPLVECLRRGRGEVLLAQKGAVVLGLPGGRAIVAGPSRGLVRRALTCMGARGVVYACGPARLAREVAAVTGGSPRACHVASWSGPVPPVDRGLDIRTLGPAYVDLVRERYSHPEYLRPGELEAALEEGLVIGGFVDGRLVGFVGESAEGTLSMLEVLESHRREGWGRALVSAKLQQQCAAGQQPWAEVWPENAASLALCRSMGFEVAPANRYWVVT